MAKTILVLEDGIGLFHGGRRNSGYRFVPGITLTTDHQGAMKRETVTAGATAWVTELYKPAEILDVIPEVMR